MRTKTTAPVPLVGRDAELAALGTRLLDQDVRLITVTGQVGVGKSRLVAALFNQVRDQFSDGGAYLDDLTDAAIDGLRDQHFLLAVDGCEDKTGDLAPKLASLVTACPRVSALVASPARLGVYGEAVVRLAPLQLPDAVRLFVERTQAVRPDFRLTEANRSAVAELCARTDGVPLAIELLAAGMELSSPHRLLAEVDRDLGCLTGTGSATLSRHHSMTAAIEWSLARLDPDERDLLARLAVFTGHFDVPAATAVGRAPRLLVGLVDKNLLSTTECQDGDLIFRMSGPTRRYLVQRHEHRAARRSHAEYFLGMVDEAPPLELLEAWHPDIEAARTYLDESGDQAGVTRLADSLKRRRRVDHPLTNREFEVAQLVACGMTNREVARKLGIAEWTAVNHMRKIMRKLECSSRVQVASWLTTLDR
nr:LuxR C-terminal-related transcriptional regulator [Kibdelosporangium sp. MJ126-NF4]CEL18604.1 Transcriptional regulator, LuxR family [Kibdelosporangium sp. MJ126-NF4]CTQ98089.1 Transcriptional regulator, LuxR family [Kibdelosporangium sp. MJ126-NF4]